MSGGDFETLLQKQEAQETKNKKKIKDKTIKSNKKSYTKPIETLNIDISILHYTIDRFLTLIEDMTNSNEFDNILKKQY